MAKQDKSLGYVLVGLVVDEPCHGYSLRARFAAGLGPVWKVAQSQHYATLHRLESEGLVTSQRQRGGTRPARVVYAATDEGRLQALSWAQSPVRRARDIRIELPAKLYILRRAAPNAVGALLKAQDRLLQRLEGRLAKQTALPSDDRAVGTLTLALRQYQVKALRAWLQHCRQVLDVQKEEG